MALTDIAVRNAKPRGKEYKLADGGGLYLLVTPSGGRLWRFKYRVHGLEKKLSLGRYPDLTLSAARKLRDAAREAVADGDDPAAAKRRQRIVAKVAVGTTFGDVALEYIEKCEREGKSPATVAKLRWSREWLLPAIGSRPVDQIEPHEVLAVLKRQEAAGEPRNGQADPRLCQPRVSLCGGDGARQVRPRVTALGRGRGPQGKAPRRDHRREARGRPVARDRRLRRPARHQARHGAAAACLRPAGRVAAGGMGRGGL